MREMGFHQCSGTGYINHTSRQALCSGVVDRYKMVSMLWLLLLLDFFRFLFVFGLLRERKSTVRWVGWEGAEGVELMSQIDCMEKIKNTKVKPQGVTPCSLRESVRRSCARGNVFTEATFQRQQAAAVFLESSKTETMWKYRHVPTGRHNGT